MRKKKGVSQENSFSYVRQSILGVHGSIFNFLCESSTLGAKLGVFQAVMGLNRL